MSPCGAKAIATRATGTGGASGYLSTLMVVVFALVVLVAVVLALSLGVVLWVWVREVVVRARCGR